MKERVEIKIIKKRTVLKVTEVLSLKFYLKLNVSLKIFAFLATGSFYFDVIVMGLSLILKAGSLESF